MHWMCGVRSPVRGRLPQTIHATRLPIPHCHSDALFTFYWRSEFIRKKQVGFFDDKVGPIALAVIVASALLAIFVAAIRDLVAHA